MQARWLASTIIVCSAVHAHDVFAQSNPSSTDDAASAAAMNARSTGRIRSGLYGTGGFAMTTSINRSSTLGSGIGVGFHLGWQFDRLVAVYARVEANTVGFSTYAEAAGIVDFTLRDRVQIGVGLGTFILHSQCLLVCWGGSSNSVAAGVSLPLHIGVVAKRWQWADGSRSGLQFWTDLAPGLALGTFVNYAFLGSAGIGWEWY